MSKTWFYNYWCHFMYMYSCIRHLFKMKYDEKEIYYKGQQERITLYLKHNTKEPNTIKSVHFTSLKRGPMGDAVIEGYINENKEADFVAYGSPEENYQFTGGLTGSMKS